MAATANNSICGVGVAHNAKLGGIRLIDGPLTDVKEAKALKHQFNYIDIYSASWYVFCSFNSILAILVFHKGVPQTMVPML